MSNDYDEDEKVCGNCVWAKPIEGFKTILRCNCPISGCYHTDVIDSESCPRWKKALKEWSTK